MFPSYYRIPGNEQSKRDWSALMEARGNVFSFRTGARTSVYPYHVRYMGPRTIAPHFHGFLEMELVITGTSLVRIGGKKFSASTGDILFLNHLDEHSETITSPRMDKLIAAFAPSAIDSSLAGASAEMLGAFRLARPFASAAAVRASGGAFKRIQHAWLNLIHEFSGNSDSAHLSLQLTALISLIIHTTGIHEERSSPMRAVFDYLAAHISEPTNVAKAVAHSGMSKSHFYRLFHRASGKPVTAYVNELRVAKAKELLAGTTLSASRIAGELGFTDAAYFHRIFRQLTGSTPDQFRRGK